MFSFCYFIRQAAAVPLARVPINILTGDFGWSFRPRRILVAAGTVFFSPFKGIKHIQAAKLTKIFIISVKKTKQNYHFNISYCNLLQFY